MKIELLDAYHIRVRLSASIIVLAPVAITIFLCFQEIATVVSSSIIIAVLLAFTNYLPIVQRQIYKKKLPFKNYAAQFLMPDDEVINPTSKKRYYKKLAEIDQTFSEFQHPNASKSFYQCCESAIRYLREKTRTNSLVMEENINYGFYRTLYSNKRIGRDYPEFCVTAKMRCKIELIFQGGSGVGCARLVYNITPTGAEVKGHPRPLGSRRRRSAP